MDIEVLFIILGADIALVALSQDEQGMDKTFITGI
jgi:hypothetical protein